MSKREAIRILMVSPGYFACDLGTRRKLVKELCLIKSEWFQNVVDDVRGRPGLNPAGV